MAAVQFAGYKADPAGWRTQKPLRRSFSKREKPSEIGAVSF